MAANHLPAVRNSNAGLGEGTPKSKRVPVMRAVTSALVPLPLSGISRSTRGGLVFLTRLRVYVKMREFKVGHLGRLFCMQLIKRLDDYEDASSSDGLEYLVVDNVCPIGSPANSLPRNLRKGLFWTPRS